MVPFLAPVNKFVEDSGTFREFLIHSPKALIRSVT
jgi:hypothetical protein